MTLWPRSIPETAVSYAGLKKFEIKVFSDLLWHTKKRLNAKIPVLKKNRYGQTHSNLFTVAHGVNARKTCIAHRARV